MPLTVLTDDNVRECLETLMKDDVLTFHKALADALHSYSTVDDPMKTNCCAGSQPKRIIVKGQDGRSTLFMPSMSDSALGVKVMSIGSTRTTPAMNSLSLSGSESPAAKSPSRDSSTPSSQSFSAPSRASTTSSMNSLNRSDSSRKGSDASSVTDASSTPSGMHPKIAENIREPLGMLPPTSNSPKGSITLLSPDGTPRAFINASTLTAFRTALASTMLVKWRKHVHTVTVFGAGLQAYWHIYLTILLRGSEIHHLHIVNRDFQRAQRMLMTLAQSTNHTISDAFLNQKLRPSILTPEFNEYSRLVKEQVRAADLLFTCTPATAPLFPASILTNSGGRNKARYIVAVGSYKPEMQELHEDILRQAVRGPEEGARSHHGIHLQQRHAAEGGAVIVDTIEGAMREAGEVIKAGIGGQGIVEIGELVMLKRSHWAEKAEREERERKKRTSEDGKTGEGGNGRARDRGHGHGIGHLFHNITHHEKQKEESTMLPDGGLKDWLERGNVIYKSVGMGLMDVVVGMELVRLAEERGFGTFVQDF